MVKLLMPLLLRRRLIKTPLLHSQLRLMQQMMRKLKQQQTRLLQMLLLSQQMLIKSQLLLPLLRRKQIKRLPPLLKRKQNLTWPTPMPQPPKPKRMEKLLPLLLQEVVEEDLVLPQEETSDNKTS